MNAPTAQNIIDPFYPDGYVSSEQDRARIVAQKEKYAASVGASNLKFPLRSIDRGFFQGNKTTITAIREDIKVLLMTVKGERLMHKEMGTNLPILAGQLFEQIDKTELLEKIRLEITGAVETYLPFLTLQNITMLTSEDDPNLTLNQIRISMSYIITDAGSAKKRAKAQKLADKMSLLVTAGGRGGDGSAWRR